MCPQSSASQQSIVRLLSHNYTGDMLPQRCPRCGCAEEGAAGVPLRFHMRFQRTIRLISVSLILLLGMALATLVLLLFGSPAPLRKTEESPMLNAHTAPAVSGKLQSEKDLSHPSALLTIVPGPMLVWQSVEGNAHIRGGLKIECGNLSVPSKGLYRVYLQITFEFGSSDHNDSDSDKHDNSDICDDELLFMKISVKRYDGTYKKDRPLLESMDTMSCKHHWRRTMYTSGTFELEDETKLQVDIQPLQLVVKYELSSFLGVELISTL